MLFAALLIKLSQALCNSKSTRFRAFLVTDNRVLNRPLGPYYVRSLTLLTHCSLAPQRFSLLRLLAPFTGSLTHIVHSLVAHLKFFDMWSCCKRVSQEQTCFSSSLETHPFSIIQRLSRCWRSIALWLGLIVASCWDGIVSAASFPGTETLTLTNGAHSRITQPLLKLSIRIKGIFTFQSMDSWWRHWPQLVELIRESPSHC